MSDNRDKRLEDLGWEKMNALLDKEMPVREQPNRGIVWWWMAAGFALAIAAFFLLPATYDSTTPLASEQASGKKSEHSIKKNTITPISKSSEIHTEEDGEEKPQRKTSLFNETAEVINSSQTSTQKSHAENESFPNQQQTPTTAVAKEIKEALPISPKEKAPVFQDKTDNRGNSRQLTCPLGNTGSRFGIFLHQN
jgi:hypothetical protein